MGKILNSDEENVSPEKQKEIFDVLKEEPYASHLGVELLEITNGGAKASLPVQDFMLNSHNTVHGAVIFALADYVFACACNSYGRTSVGLSTNINFMNSGAPFATLTGTATEISKNHKISWYKILVEDGETVIASMEATAYRKKDYFIS